MPEIDILFVEEREPEGPFGAKGVGAFFFRGVFGVDHIFNGPYYRGGPYGPTAFAVEPGFGLQFHVVRHLVVGFAVDFPIGLFDPFTAVDCQLLGFLGVRF
jgi:hypothetical protein